MEAVLLKIIFHINALNAEWKTHFVYIVDIICTSTNMVQLFEACAQFMEKMKKLGQYAIDFKAIV